MKCKNCSLCRGYWLFGGRGKTRWGWKCKVLNEYIFNITDDEAKLLGLPFLPMFDSYKDHWKEENIKIWQLILDVNCIASANDVIQFIDVSQNEMQDIDVKLSVLLDDKQYLQDDIYQASLVLGEKQK